MQILYNQGQTAKQVGNGVQSTAGEFGDALVSELQPRYYEQAYRGNVFFSVAQAVTFSAQNLTSQTQTGLLISNPAASVKNLIPIQAEFGLTAVVANTNTIFQMGLIMQPFSNTAITNTTASTIFLSKGASSTGTGTAATASQSWGLPVAPVLAKYLFSALVTTTTYIGGPTNNTGVIDFNGALIVPPGCSLGICGSLADTGHVTLSWLEIPL